MPQKKYYNPQDDVVQIKDGKRIKIEPYDMYAEMHKGPENIKAKSQQTPSQDATEKGPLSMRFDGQYLTLIHKEGNKTVEYNYPAISGKPVNGFFDYSKEQQNKKNEGPIPEGTHTVDTETTNYWKDADLWQKTKSYLGGGEFPGGTRAWGEGHVDVKLDPNVAKKTGRSGITIHGGTTPGSKGCIDLVNHDKSFFDKLEELKGEQQYIPLTVDYSQTPEKVQRNADATLKKEEKNKK